MPGSSGITSEKHLTGYLRRRILTSAGYFEGLRRLAEESEARSVAMVKECSGAVRDHLARPKGLGEAELRSFREGGFPPLGDRNSNNEPRERRESFRTTRLFNINL